MVMIGMHAKSGFLLRVLFILCSSLLIFGSFYYYAAFNHMGFNSDHAVHVLMAKHFDWQHGTYYWGQNRLGSFLPWLASYPVKWFHFHPLHVTGILNYVFLISGFMLLAGFLKSYFQKVLLAVFIFWPLYSFHYLLLLGHPYGAQLFLIALAAVSLHRSGGWLLAQEYVRSGIWISLFMACCVTAFWVSELSGMFFILFFMLVITDREILCELWKLAKSKMKWAAITLLYLFGLLLVSYKFYAWTKTKAPADAEYDRVFISTPEEISNMWKFMKEDMYFRMSNADGDWRWTMFYYSLWLCGAVMFIHFMTRLLKRKKIITPLLAMAMSIIAGGVLLFFSTWNYRFEFDVKYFIPVYLFAVFYFLYAVNHVKRWAGYSLLLLCSLAAIGALADNKRVLGLTSFNTRHELEPFSKLKPGGLIGGYWLTYRVAAFAPDNLLAIPIDADLVRNAHHVEEVLNKERIYVIKNGFLPDSLPMPDTLKQYNRILTKFSSDTTISHITFSQYRLLR